MSALCAALKCQTSLLHHLVNPLEVFEVVRADGQHREEGEAGGGGGGSGGWGAGRSHGGRGEGVWSGGGLLAVFIRRYCYLQIFYAKNFKPETLRSVDIFQRLLVTTRLST